MSSACGVCGRDSRSTRPCPRTGRGSAESACRPRAAPFLPSRLRERQSIFAATGGLHAAGLFRPTAPPRGPRGIGRHKRPTSSSALSSSAARSRSRLDPDGFGAGGVRDRPEGRARPEFPSLPPFPPRRAWPSPWPTRGGSHAPRFPAKPAFQRLHEPGTGSG